VNRDPFLRLALIALCSVYVAGIVALEFWLGVWAAGVTALLGLMGASALTYEASPKKTEPDRRRRQRQPAEGTRGFERIE
jgi:CHASE2 domain-containing sensor protein